LAALEPTYPMIPHTEAASFPVVGLSRWLPLFSLQIPPEN
jgi:hypothetical protein